MDVPWTPCGPLEPVFGTLRSALLYRNGSSHPSFSQTTIIEKTLNRKQTFAVLLSHTRIKYFSYIDRIYGKYFTCGHFRTQIHISLASPPQSRPSAATNLPISNPWLKPKVSFVDNYSPSIYRTRALTIQSIGLGPFHPPADTCNIQQPPTMQIRAPSAKPVLQQTAGDFSPLSSPIESIPNEILIRVMKLAVPGPDLPRNAFSATIRLSHVSRRFRFVANNTSELWKVICPKFPLTYDQVQFWLDVLARSGARSVDILIHTKGEFRGAVQPYRAFLEAVVSHSDRWRKFEITSKTWEPIDLFLDQSRHLVLLPGLEELTLHHADDPGRVTNWGGEVSSSRFRNILFGKDTAAPMLKIIKLGATYFDYSRMRSLAKDLVELHLENHTYPPTSDVPEMIIDMLRASPRLQVLTVTSLNMQFNNWPQPVELRDLERLEFRGFPQNAEHIFSVLRVPSLKVLVLGRCRFAAEETVTMPPVFAANSTMRILIDLFTSSANSPWCWRAGGLRELSLEYSRCSAREVVRFLRQTSNVETFHASSPAMLHVLANNPGILPNLRHWVVKSSIFCAPRPFSAILTDRPGVTLSVEGDLTRDGERLHDTLKDTHNIIRT